MKRQREKNGGRKRDRDGDLVASNIFLSYWVFKFIGYPPFFI
jgi:hypothetical protein